MLVGEIKLVTPPFLRGILDALSLSGELDKISTNGFCMRILDKFEKDNFSWLRMVRPEISDEIANYYVILLWSVTKNTQNREN
jgi:hypothetical protein